MSTSDSTSFRAGLKSGRARQKTHTRRLLLETTARLLASGGSPTVTEVADAAGVSRRTAYRYFESAKRLHADAALEKLRPAMESAIDSSTSSTSIGGIDARIDALVESMQRLALENESLLRTMIHETVLTPAPGAAPRRGSRRLEWIESAIAPLQRRLAPADYKRVVNALALCTGIEALLVLRDICCLTPADATRVSQWMCRAIVRQSLNERAATRVNKRARSRKSS
jgi:AcrR family transcriptional regulator